MERAAAAFRRERGQDEAGRLYRVINNIIAQLDAAPSDALRDLAAIDDLRLSVSTTPDRLLAKALNEVRFQGEPKTRELAYCPNQSTNEQMGLAHPAAPTETVVLNLFGQSANTPVYAIDEEDRLEWIHALLIGEPTGLPEWLANPLKQQPMLFIGCDFADAVWQFLLRTLTSERLSVTRKQFFFVGSDSHVPSLSGLSATDARKPLFQRLDMAPTEFAAELHARWEEQTPEKRRVPVGRPKSFS